MNVVDLHGRRVMSFKTAGGEAHFQSSDVVLAPQVLLQYELPYTEMRPTVEELAFFDQPEVPFCGVKIVETSLVGREVLSSTF